MTRLNTSIDDLLAMAKYYLNKTETFKHCSYCGFVYEGQGEGQRDYTNPVIDFKALTGKTSIPYTRADGYKLTSGACPPCFETEMVKLKQRKANK